MFSIILVFGGLIAFFGSVVCLVVAIVVGSDFLLNVAAAVLGLSFGQFLGFLLLGFGKAGAGGGEGTVMLLYSQGQRVWVTRESTAPTSMWGRVGTITFEPLPQRSSDERGLGELIEQQYMVRFDDTGREDAVWESWLDLV